jgi:hypothetical protein
MCDRDQKQRYKLIPCWLLLAVLLLAFTTHLASAADKEQTAAKEMPKAANATRLPGRIITLDGKTYEKATLERVDPDGLLVMFAPVEGGLGNAKLKFRNLPAELRERCGYDPDRALEYEIDRARGEAIWIAEYALWTEQRWAAQAEEATKERQLRLEAGLRLAAEAEQARVDAARRAEESASYPYYQSGWSWPGNYYSYSTGRNPRSASHHSHVSLRMHAGDSSCCAVSPTVSQTIGPMRPFGK